MHYYSSNNILYDNLQPYIQLPKQVKSCTKLYHLKTILMQKHIVHTKHILLYHT